MICIAITRETFAADESRAIRCMLSTGVIDRVHIRKPGADSTAVEALLRAIGPDFYSRLSLHSHHYLASRYGTGIHLNAANPHIPEGFHGIVSRSCHSLEELRHPSAYSFLSPIFDSISKPGYRAAFTPDRLRGGVDRRCVALGGVKAEHIPLLWEIGFGGTAFLGYIWDGYPEQNLIQIEKYKKLCCNS